MAISLMKVEVNGVPKPAFQLCKGKAKGNMSLFILDNRIRYLSCSSQRSSKGHPSWVQRYYRRKPEYHEKTCDVWQGQTGQHFSHM